MQKSRSHVNQLSKPGSNVWHVTLKNLCQTVLTASEEKIIIDHEKYGQRGEFDSVEDAEKRIKECGIDASFSVLWSNGKGSIINERGEVVGEVVERVLLWDGRQMSVEELANHVSVSSLNRIAKSSNPLESARAGLALAYLGKRPKQQRSKRES